MTKIDTKRRRVSFKTKGQSMTRQSHKAECDINNIVNRFNKDGVITHLQKHGERYDDVTGADYKTWMDKIVSANHMFEELPSHVRNRFGNDPAAFLDFVQDEKNIKEMQKLGLSKGLPENPAPSTLLNPNNPTTINTKPEPTVEHASTVVTGSAEAQPTTT